MKAEGRGGEGGRERALTQQRAGYGPAIYNVMFAYGRQQFNTPRLIPSALHECGYNKRNPLCNAPALKIVKALL